MNQKNLDITLLCKVVDNFGDVGVVFRLARALTEIDNFSRDGTISCDGSFSHDNNFSRDGSFSINLRIVIDNLHSFSLLEPKIDPLKKEQTVNNWKILNWNESESCLAEYRKNPPHLIIECFQCGRPEWLEELLFTEKVPNIVHIIMLDYLTAEDYAETFHKLQSLTRSARVQKVNFMPGFTKKTGGLILDKPFLKALKNKKSEELQTSPQSVGKCNFSTHESPTSPHGSNNFNAIFFSYSKNWLPAIKALFVFNEKYCNGKLNVHLAKGAGYESFKACYEQMENTKQKPFTLTELSFLPQTEWDALLAKSPLLFIRGEDSLSRAALCSVPFVWHAYPQTEEYQLVKVRALLERMKPFFEEQDFSVIERCWISYNTTEISSLELENALTEFLLAYPKLTQGFVNFSASLLENGNLAEHLLEFIKSLKGVSKNCSF